MEIPVRDRRRLAIASVGVILVTICAALAVTMFLRRTKEADSVAPVFVLRDQEGRLTSLAQFRDKVVVLTFIDPECTQICPLTTQSMMEALKILGPASASQVQLLGININPLKTQVADVAAYTRSHELQESWRFLTGSRAQLESVWRSYHVYVDAANDSDDIVHEAVIFLIDGSGHESTIDSTPMSYEAVGGQAQMLAEEIAHLLPGHPAVSSEAAQQDTTPLKPTEFLRLPALGPNGQPVVLGGAQHLFLFFAGWLRQDADLSKQLATLDSYAALARQQGWPAPVAVDELTAEPSPTEARQVLTPLAATLHTPIVEDADGRLADGYLVEDLPCFVLSSPSGKILWHHDGWLPAAVISQDVRTALAGE